MTYFVTRNAKLLQAFDETPADNRPVIYPDLSVTAIQLPMAISGRRGPAGIAAKRLQYPAIAY